MTDSSQQRHDVAILGGGLAGLTLALQIKRTRPETSVVVTEKRPGPAPDSAFKVGESTSEIGSYYFREVVGLADHLDSEHLRKFGLGFFFPAGDNSDIARRVEFPSVRNPAVYTHQIDRGRFENELAKRCRDVGVDLIQGAFVDAIELGADAHRVTIVRGGPGGERSTLAARWLVDASGRASLLKRKLGLEHESGHHINSAWFRLAGGFDVEDFSNDEEWLGRMPERGLRRRTTGHLMGEGYWVWLIQLATGPASIGVCADPRFHPFEQIKEFDRLVEWFHEHEPQLGATVEKRRDDVLDFLTVGDFSYLCKRVYSPDRWCLTGEAGVFLDPLYSPGSDYIGLSNTFITELIARDLAGEEVVPSSRRRRWKSRGFFWMAGKAATGKSRRPPPFDVAKATRKAARDNPLEFFNFFFLLIAGANLAVYRDQYQLFGNAQVMLAKGVWGAFIYWSNLATLFTHGKFRDTDFLASVIPDLDRLGRLGIRMEEFFREWHALDRREWTGISVRTMEFPHLVERQAELVKPATDEELRAKITENGELLSAMAVILFHRAAAGLPEKPADDVPINPLGVSLRPERWKKDGLFSEPGITLTAAKRMLPGIEEFFLEERGATVFESTMISAR